MSTAEQLESPVDLGALGAWMYERGVGAGPITNVHKLGGGTQNIVLRFTQAGRDYVLRRPPLHKRDGNDETMRREARILAALAASAVPHPRLIAACAHDRPLGARARRDGDEWVIIGEKWFTTNAREAAFFVVMLITNPEVAVHRGASMFLIPADTAVLEIVRDVRIAGEQPGHPSHGYLRFTDARVGADALLGEEGKAFAIAQTRLGGGRIHHAMRTIGAAQKAFDLMCERAVSRRTHDGTLADLGITKQKIAQSWIEIEQFRLFVPRTAWLIDKHNDYKVVRKDIAAVKAAMPVVLRNVVQRAMHLYGSLGVSEETPFGRMLMEAEWLAIVDGPSEVHEITVAKQLLAEYPPHPDVWGSGHLPRLREEALAKLGVSADA